MSDNTVMSEASESLRIGAGSHERPPRLLGIFAAWRLQAYGYTLAAFYAAILICLHSAWIVDRSGATQLNDFSVAWIAGQQALQGETASLYDPAKFIAVQTAVVGPDHRPASFYPNWPYPPIFFLVLAPLAMLPYVAAFLTWEMVTLLGCVGVVYLIVRRPSAIALLLASPLTAVNFCAGQSGFLTASLVGAAVLALERQPVLAGAFVGCLAVKPQFGLLFPVALVAARQWRAFASAAVTGAVLAGVSVAAFGISPWEAFPRQLLVHAGDYLLHEHPRLISWSYFQTVYGSVRALSGSAVLAWPAQGCATIGVAIIVWLVWRSPVRYALKAATLSAATLIATPFAFAYDMAAIAIPVAFLARDQISCGLLRGEQTIMITLFAAGLVILVCLGSSLLGPVVMIALLCMILRRDLSWWGTPHIIGVREA